MTALQRKGFTLIEMLVSVALFSIVMMICVGTLLALVDANRKAQNVSMITTNFHFALDLMTRTIRTGTDYYCSSDYDDYKNYGIAVDKTQNCENGVMIAFKDQDGLLKAYLFNSSGQTIEVVQDTDKNGNLNETPLPLISDQLKALDMKFVVRNANRYTEISGADSRQPTVTLLIQAQAGADPDTDAIMYIQSTVTQRTFDI